MVPLSPLDLKDHAAFDRLDASLPEGPARLKAYDDLARLAPDDRLVLVRGGLAAIAEGTDKGRAVLAGVLARTTTRWPDDPDVLYLSLLDRRSRLANGSPDARELAAAAADFVTRHPGWKGPAGATAADVERIRAAAEAAIVDVKPGPTDGQH